MQRPSELLKPFANSLARAVLSESGRDVARFMRLSGSAGQRQINAQDQPPSESVEKRSAEEVADLEQVGIWERKSKDRKSYFVRRMDKSAEWSFWSNVGRIAPKGAKRRVIFLGESVARGFLYDPLFNPAKALEMILQLHLGETEVEVIDLARTDLLMAGLLEVARSALVLQPDAAVIFAGNNWRPFVDLSSTEDLRDVPSIAMALGQQGVSGLKHAAEEWLAADSRRVVNQIASLYATKAIPVVWIIPEFNLGDWREPDTNAPHLSNGGNREWIEQLDGARRALREDDMGAASESARKLVELDGGICVAGFYVLA